MKISKQNDIINYFSLYDKVEIKYVWNMWLFMGEWIKYDHITWIMDS